MACQQLTKYNKGQSLIEILIAITLLAVLLPALFSSIVLSQEGRLQRSRRDAAELLIKEAWEAIRVIRESGWQNINVNGTYHTNISGSTWVLAAGVETIDSIYTRSITILPVYRDNNGNISDTGLLDSSTKRIVINISWNSPIPANISSTGYLTRNVSNNSWIQTTESDFLAGLASGVVTNTAGGEISLMQAPEGWDDPAVASSLDISGTGNAQTVYINDGYIYLGRTNSTDDPDFIIVNVTNPFHISEMSAIDIGATVYSIKVEGDYAYLATDSNSKELIVYDISNKSSPEEVATLDLAGDRDAFSIFLSGNYAYLGRATGGSPSDHEFYILNISDPHNPSVKSSLRVDGSINGVSAKDNYAYAASGKNDSEFMIIDIEDKDLPTLVNVYDTDSNSDANDVFIKEDRAYLVTDFNGGSSPDPQEKVEFYILDISDVNNIAFIGSYNFETSISSVYVEEDYAFLCQEAPDRRFVVLDISDEQNPFIFSSLDMGALVMGSIVIDDVAYLATTNNDNELVILIGGSGAYNYFLYGEYESLAFDAQAEVAYNYLQLAADLPQETEVRFQYAVTNDPLVWNYIGPDGTDQSFYTASGAIRLDHMLGRYIKIKLYLLGDGGVTPVVDYFSVNYSP